MATAFLDRISCLEPSNNPIVVEWGNRRSAADCSILTPRSHFAVKPISHVDGYSHIAAGYTEQAMTCPLQEWLATAHCSDGASATETEIRAVESQIGSRLPDPVRLVLATACRPEGFVGGSYIAFFTLDDLAQCWRNAQDSARGFIPFASNGAGEWYGLDSRRKDPLFVLMPSIGTEWAAAMLLGATWDEFWKTLRSVKLFAHAYQSAPE